MAVVSLAYADDGYPNANSASHAHGAGSRERICNISSEFDCSISNALLDEGTTFESDDARRVQTRTARIVDREDKRIPASGGRVDGSQERSGCG